MKSSLLIIMLVVFSFISNAQSNQRFIDEISVTESSLSAKQKSMVEKARGNKTYKKVQYVKMGDLAAIQKGGDFVFTIPGRAGEIKATARYIKADSKDNYEWHGTVDGGTGSVIVLSRKGKITASISLQNEQYEILSTDNSMHLLVSYNMEVVEEGKHCATDEIKSKKSSDNIGNISSDNIKSISITPNLVIRECMDYVRVLVLYTPAARTAVADINQTIDLCVSQFQSAVYRSNMTSRTTIELAGRQELNFVETRDIFADTRFLSQNSSAQIARNNTNADLVILLTNSSDYGGYLGNAATVEPDNALSYSIVQVNHATNKYATFVHETGHLYGCRHETDAGGQLYAHGYTFKPDLFERCWTVMASGTTTQPVQSHLLNFSNPNVFIQGKATGTASNNNARRVTETYATIMGFRPPVSRPFGVYIYGPEYGQAYSTTYTWEAAVECGTGPYTYEWRTSSDGFNYSGVRGTADKFSDRLTCPSGSYYYVHLDVRSSNGQTSYYTQAVNIDKSTCQPYITKLDNKSILNKEVIVENVQLKDAYPNPSAQVTQIQFLLPEEAIVKLEVFDVHGRKMKMLVNSKLPSGTHVKSLKGLTKGIYFYRLTAGTFRQTKSLIVQ